VPWVIRQSGIYELESGINSVQLRLRTLELMRHGDFRMRTAMADSPSGCSAISLPFGIRNHISRSTSLT
jgi:hypothetical protein